MRKIKQSSTFPESNRIDIAVETLTNMKKFPKNKNSLKINEFV